MRSIFGILNARKTIFSNPISTIKTGYICQGQPLPVDPGRIREALGSPDSAQASIIALAAFHGLRAGQIRALQLTDIQDGYLHVDDRKILLAPPVRTPVPAWLDYRAPVYPRTSNSHLFVTNRSAVGDGPVGPRWFKVKADIVPGGVQAIREDRILHEAHTTGRDVRRICDFFGLSVQAATRYAATVDSLEVIRGAQGPAESC